MAAIRNLDRFDRRRPFGPWLHRIVVNRAIDAARARSLRGETELYGEAAEATTRSRSTARCSLRSPLFLRSSVPWS